MPTTRPKKTAAVLLAIAAPAVVFAMYMALIWAPDERTLGTVQRIFYIHVGSAWNAYLAFLIVFVTSIGYLLRRRPALDAVAASAAEIGILFTTLTLATGSFWARAVWNVWWTWDPRLTTTLIMWFMY
ncbi:MAG: cytochrome c biogenesis protein, partial [Limnochordales bacterium]